MTSRPTSRHIALLLLVATITAACADAPQPGDTSPRGIPHAQAPSDLLLRWGYEGGFTPPEFQLTNLPSFSLYGDGTIVRPGPQMEIYPGPALPALETTRLDERGIQAILQAALDADLATVTDLTDMGSVGIADAAETVFTLRFGEVDRSVRIYALAELGGQMPGMSDDEFHARKRLLAFVEQLSSLETWLPEGSVSGSTVFEPSGTRAFVTRYRGRPDLPQEPIAWPLATPLGGIGADAGAGFRCVAVTGQDWAQVLQPAASTASQLSPWTSEERRYAVAFRPLLPDEATC